MDPLTADEVSAEPGLEGWVVRDGALHARFTTGDMTTGVELVRRIAGAADEADHHPDLHLTYPRVAVELTTHDVGGLTAKDVGLAREISGLAAAMGLAPEPPRPS